MFSGAFGHTYGHGCVWCSISEKERSDFNPCTWYEALHYEGAEQIRYIRALLDDLQIMTYQPVWEICPEMPNDKMDLHIQACASPDRKTLCVYFPGGGTATLKLDAFWDAPHKKVYLWWYNPRDGKFYKDEQTTTDQPESVVLSGADLTVSAPSAGEEKDWVLLIMTEQTGIPVKVKCCSQQEEVREIRKVFEW
ncbi:MAG: glycoside hydrolase family 140 protein [Lachnospiraceae bacterium]